jgi:type I restriction enzyme S subunit
MRWEKQPMGCYLSLLTDFSANGSYEYLDSHVVMFDEPEYALMIRTTDLESQDFSVNVKYISKEAYEILGKSKLYGGEIIMNKIGSAGKVYFMPTLNIPASLGRNAFMFRYKDSINSVYIFYLLTSTYGETEISKHIIGAVTKTITKDAVRSIPIIAPPIRLQNEFAAFVQQADKSKFTTSLSINNAFSLYSKATNKL